MRQAEASSMLNEQRPPHVKTSHAEHGVMPHYLQAQRHVNRTSWYACGGDVSAAIERLWGMTRECGEMNTHSRVNRRRSSFLAWSKIVAGPGSTS